MSFEFFQLDAGPLGQSLYGLREGEIFAHLHEFEHIAAGTTGKTLEYLLVGVNVHTGAMVVVKRT